jgi:hypothetical protein
MRFFLSNTTKSFFLVTALISCNRFYCEKESFYNIYQKKYDAKELYHVQTKNDLQVKRSIFEKLCISNNVNSLLILEAGTSLSYTPSRGLIFNYDNSLVYYYNLINGKIFTGKGYGKNTDLHKILLLLRKDFEKIKKIAEQGGYDDIADSPIVDVTLYKCIPDSSFIQFSFPIVIGNVSD